jgi:hypothetical protein
VQRPLYVAIGVDCDPDRSSYPRQLTWRGIEALPRLLDIDDVRWTLNVRADTQVRDYCGSAAYCWQRYRDVWDNAVERGSSIAWHLHYFGRDGRQDVSEANILENITVGSEALEGPSVVHMGWTFQNDFSLRQLARVGVRVDYSPVPRLRFAGRGGVDAYDWHHFAYRPQYRHGVQMIPAYSFRHTVLARRFGTERVLLTTTTTPLLFRSLLSDFFRTGSDFFVSYFHADEIIGGVGGWRDRLYSYRHLVANIERLRTMAAKAGYEVRFVTIPELARILFDESHRRYA